MDNKVKVKVSLDICMTILIFAVMSYQYLGEKNHEIAGTILFVLFILHHVLNWHWYKTLMTGRYSPRRVLQVIIDSKRIIEYIFKKYHLYEKICPWRWYFDYS